MKIAVVVVLATAISNFATAQIASASAGHVVDGFAVRIGIAQGLALAKGFAIVEDNVHSRDASGDRRPP